MYKTFYKGTKNYDYNLYISCSKSNYSKWGYDKKLHSRELHLGKLHIALTKYGKEVMKKNKL